MERKLYRELWQLRFQKMLGLEKQSITDYEELLGDCRKECDNHPIQTHLEKLIADEKKHVRLVEELIEILNRQPD